LQWLKVGPGRTAAHQSTHMRTPSSGPNNLSIPVRSVLTLPAKRNSVTIRPRHACPACVLTHTDLDKRPGQRPKIVVEVAGIEPASFNFSPSILRAQPVTFLGCRLATGGGRRLKPT
jgi:hypothetical protein